MKIREVNENKKQFISLLLLADEQESMVDRYLEKGNTLIDGCGLYDFLFNLSTKSSMFCSRFLSYSLFVISSIPTALLPSNSL